MARARPICRHPESSPEPEALAVVARLWAEKKTGFVTWKGGEARLVEGEPPTGEDLQILVSRLYREGDIEFVGADVDLPKSGAHLANELWFAAIKAVDRRALKGRASDNLVPGPARAWGSRLPVRYATKKVVARVEKEEVPLKFALDIPREVRGDVIDEVCALILIGVLYVQRSGPRTVTEPYDRVRELAGAWARVQSTDDWGLFDAQPGIEDHVLDAAVERRLGHFQAFVVDSTLPAQGVALAKRIQKRHTAAAARIRAGEALGPTENITVEDCFMEGMKRLKAEAYGEAVKCFSRANKRYPGQPRNACWMAYAIYKDASRDEAERKAQAIALAEKVSRVDRKGDALYVLARIAYDGGDHLECWTKLGRILVLNPKHKRARKLHKHVSMLLEGSADLEEDEV